jgi:hypothetical protein
MQPALDTRGDGAPVERRARRLALTARFLAFELVMWGVLYGLYTVIRDLAIGQRTEAFANARRVVDVEQALGIAHERDMQAALTASESLRSFFNTYYELGFFPVMIGGLLLLGLRRRALYREIRNVLLLAIGVAAILFIAIPTAPPRLVTDLGIQDTIGMIGHDVGSFRGIDYNPYAAMPSMHVGWTVLISIGLARAVSRRRLQILVALHPVLMVLAVVATGNHFLLDAVVGAAIAVGALVTVRMLTHPARSGSDGRRRVGEPAGAYGRVAVGARGGD